MEPILTPAQMDIVVEMEDRNVVGKVVASSIAKIMQLITTMTVLLIVHRVIKDAECAPLNKS